MAKEYRLPEHVRAIHDAIAMHPRLVVLANGTGGVYFKGYPRTEADNPADRHFIRVHESLYRVSASPNSGCLVLHKTQLGTPLANKVRECFREICTPMPEGGDNASFLRTTQVADIVAAIRAFGDRV